MNKKLILGGGLILIFVLGGFFSFINNKVEYSDFAGAIQTGKTCQVKGTWMNDKESRFDAINNQFIFYMKDEKGVPMKVVLDGAKPNNFEMAESIVAKGKVKDGYFHAKEVLTKCPSKYDATGKDVHKTIDN